MVETPTFYPYLSGRANLRYFQGIGRRGAPADVDRLLDLVDLGSNANGKFSTYSLGMKPRLGVACALLGDPELVFLDEPTNGQVGPDLAVVADHAARWHQVAPQRFHAVCLLDVSWEFGMRDPRVPSVWSLVWALIDPVSCVSCVSW